MKREGRIHGCSVRLGKRGWGDGGHRGKITFNNKPTNQSKSTMKHPIPSGAPIVYNEHELPMQKSVGKTKSAFKAKDLDITRNHLMQDWKIYDGGVPVEGNYDDNEGSDDYREHWTSDEYGNDGQEEEEEEDEGEDEDEQEESWDSDYRARSQMVLPIESLLTVGKRKKQPRRQQQLTLTDAVGVAEIMVEVPATDDGNNTDQFESWWGLGFYDEEEVPDDWFLITEGEDFVVPA